MPSACEGGGAPADSRSDLQKSKKKNKVRAAWISFVGRIVAQAMGAAATIGLGLAVVGQYHTASVRAIGTSEPNALAETQSALRIRPASSDLSLAVLSFRDVSPGPRQEGIGEGMGETLTAALSAIQGLRVLSRTSTLHYARAGEPVPQIGRRLNVDFIVEGSIARAGDRYRVIVRLIDARSDEQRWCATYYPDSKTLLSLEAEVAESIARDLKAKTVVTRGSSGDRPVAD
jgi:TolB-like protein